jgi:hypothetical protein
MHELAAVPSRLDHAPDRLHRAADSAKTRAKGVLRLRADQGMVSSVRYTAHRGCHRTQAPCPTGQASSALNNASRCRALGPSELHVAVPALLSTVRMTRQGRLTEAVVRMRAAPTPRSSPASMLLKPRDPREKDGSSQPPVAKNASRVVTMTLRSGDERLRHAEARSRARHWESRREERRTHQDITSCVTDETTWPNFPNEVVDAMTAK